MILAITGHRPQHIAGFDPQEPRTLKIQQELRTAFRELKPAVIISGMALGVDQWAAEAAVELDIPFRAYIPCVGQESRWFESSKRHYYSLLEKAQHRLMVSNQPYTPNCMLERNQRMIDHCDQLLAVYKPSKAGGGTQHAIGLAKSAGKPINRIMLTARGDIAATSYHQPA